MKKYFITTLALLLTLSLTACGGVTHPTDLTTEEIPTYLMDYFTENLENQSYLEDSENYPIKANINRNGELGVTINLKDATPSNIILFAEEITTVVLDVTEQYNIQLRHILIGDYEGKVWATDDGVIGDYRDGTYKSNPDHRDITLDELAEIAENETIESTEATE